MALELLVTDEAVCLDKPPSDPKAKVVNCNSTAAAYQIAGKGTPISKDVADRFGVKTKPAELAGYTLRLDGSTIARTPEDKAFAATLPQPGLTLARAEQMRSAAALSIAALQAADAVKAAEATEEAKKADAEEDKKLKAKVEDKSANAPRKRAGRKSKKEEAAKPATG